MHSPVSGGWDRLARHALAAALTLPLLATAAHAKDEPKKPTQKNFQDWTLVCQKPEKADKDVCVLVQTLVSKDKDSDKERPLMRVETVITNTGESGMIFALPLGFFLPQGLSLQVDEGEAKRFPVEVCVPDGCRAALATNDDLLKALRSGSQAKLTFYANPQKPVTFPVSLKGFSAGYKALQDARK